jgi:RNA polymerase sigma-70 factor (ECF subfamily)
MADRAAPVALAQLVADHHQALYRYAYRLSGSQPDAEDLTQQVYLIAQEKLGQVRDPAGVRPWLFTVLRNCYLKTNRKRLALPVADFDISEVPDEAPQQPLDGEQLQEAINALGDEFKVVVLMFYFEQRSYREISELLEIPPGTVMSRLARAKGHLRRLLSESQRPKLHDRTPTPHPQSAFDPRTAIRH